MIDNGPFWSIPQDIERQDIRTSPGLGRARHYGSLQQCGPSRCNCLDYSGLNGFPHCPEREGLRFRVGIHLRPKSNPL